MSSAVLAVVLVPLFLITGSAKVCALPLMRANAEHLGFSVPQFRAIGLLELAGAAGLVVGLAVHPIGAAAATGFVLLLVAGALAHHRRHDATPRVIAPLAVALGAVAYLVTLI